MIEGKLETKENISKRKKIIIDMRSINCDLMIEITIHTCLFQ